MKKSKINLVLSFARMECTTSLLPFLFYQNYCEVLIYLPSTKTKMKCPLFLTLPLSIPSINNNSNNNNSTIHEQALLNEYYILRTQRYLELYSTLLAIRHVNERNGTFVEWLSNITSVCPNNDDFSIPYVFLSDNGDAERNFIAHEFNVTSNGQNYVHFDNNYDHDDVSFCGIIGPVDSNYAAQISRLKRDLLNYDEIDLVQVTPYAFIDENHENLNSKLIRVSAGAETIASRLYDYLITTLGRDYIAILSDSVEENFGKIFADNVNLTSRGTTIEFALYDGQASLEYSANHPHHVYNALELVADSKFSTIVLVEGSQAHALLPQIISKADELGLISKEHMWIIVPHELSSGLEYYKHVHSNADPDSLEEKFLRGLQFFDYSNVNLSTKFSNHLLRDEGLDSDIVNMISTFSPVYFNATDIMFVRMKSTVTLTNAGLLFDSVLRFFLSFCGQFGNLGGVTGMFSSAKGAYIDAFSVLNLVMSNDSEGASTLSPVAVIDNGAWLAFGNASYYDGSNNPPEALRTVREDKNYISSIGSSLVLVAFSFIIFLSSTMGYIVYTKRKLSTIRSIDPWFLYILILTSAVSSFSLLGLVADERVVYDDIKLLDTMCHLIVLTLAFSDCIPYYTYCVKVNESIGRPFSQYLFASLLM